MIKKWTVKLNEQELEDIKSALDFFIEDFEYVHLQKAPTTIKDMKKLLKKLRKIK